MANTIFRGFLFLTFILSIGAQAVEIPDVHSGIEFDPDSNLIFIFSNGDTLHLYTEAPAFSRDMFTGGISGTEVGVSFDFGDPDFKGRLHYGFIDIRDGNHIFYPTYYKRTSSIDSGRAEIDILNKMRNKYDMIGWQKSGKIRLGYRVIDHKGKIMYDGRIQLRGFGPFVVDTSLIEGPLIKLQ